MKIRPEIASYTPIKPSGLPGPAPDAAPAQPLDHGLNLDPRRQRLFMPDGRALAFPTDGSTFTIGRLPGSTVEIDQPLVSRHHADGKWESGQLWLRDKSSRGTLINGQPAKPGEWVAVPDGARVHLGDTQQPPLVLGVGGSQTVMMRIDQSKLAPDSAGFHLRTADGTSVPLPAEGKITRIGRELGTDVYMPTSSTSRKHAELKWQQGQLLVRDLGSSNGTYIDGKKIEPAQWVAVPQGGKLNFGGGEKAQVVFEPKDPLVVTFFGDGSVPDIGGEVKAQPRRFERAISNNNAPAVVRGMVAEGSMLKDAAMASAPVAFAGAGLAGLVGMGAGIAAVAVGGPLGIPLLLWGATMAGTGGYASFSTRHMFKGGWAALKEKFKRDPAQVASPWKHVQRVVVSQGPKIGQFQELWKENLRNWPSSRHVVFISGHGSQSGAAGLKFADVGKTVQGAEAIFLDACNGAQIESLSKLTGSAKVAVASEHTVRGYGFPLDDMFGRNQFPGDARALGAALVQAANQSQPSQSLVAVDLRALKQQLLPGLDRLGQGLDRLREQGYGPAIKEALNNSETTKASGLSKKIDLGSFLSNLSKAPGVRQACPELAQAEDAFNKTILSMTGHGTISFDRSPDKDLPQGWRDFLKHT